MFCRFKKYRGLGMMQFPGKVRKQKSRSKQAGVKNKEAEEAVSGLVPRRTGCALLCEETRNGWMDAK